MAYRDSANQIAAYRDQIAELRRKMREVQATIEPEPVANNVFATPSGPRTLRVADTRLHPGDDFCTLRHLLDLLPEGAADWRPRYSYA